MITSNDVLYQIREAKSRAKQQEFRIEQKDYPKYVKDSRDLDFSAVYALSRYAKAVHANNKEGIEEFSKDLKTVSLYFNAATNIIRDYDHTIDYFISGACAYFLSNDFGSAKALLMQTLKAYVKQEEYRRLMIAVMLAACGHRQDQTSIDSDQMAGAIYKGYLSYIDTGEKFDEVMSFCEQYRELLFSNGDIFGVYYIDILIAVLINTEHNLAWHLLPSFSRIDKEKWAVYLSKAKATKVLWSAQRIIGEGGIYAGKSGIIQLPTGVGKTTSIELILRSAFLGERANSAIIITPLRALCGEIKSSLQSAFLGEATVNQFSDVLQNDFSFAVEDGKKNIVVCTPEKLKYIIHHSKDFLSNIELFIFDEGHMFDSAKRGAAYELLVTTIKSEIGDSKQCVFISAVLSNAKVIGDWLFDGNGVIVSSDNIKTTEKNIGFVSLSQDIQGVEYYADGDFLKSSFYVKNVIKTDALKTPTGKPSVNRFPTSVSKDISLYLMNLLTKNGAVAIYISNPAWISGYIKRIAEVEAGGISFDNLKKDVDEIESAKLQYLFYLHYGENNDYAKGARLGVFPHYADLEEGVKLSVEYAMRKGMIKNVLCTSTLAQGVNMPIRYLLITAFDSFQRSMSARELQNLIGRTARAGMHTEGSVIITDVDLYAQRGTTKNGGIYRWAEKTALFNPLNSEPCGSAIHMLVEQQEMYYKYKPYSFAAAILEAVEDGGIRKLKIDIVEKFNNYTIAQPQEKLTIESNVRRYLSNVENVVSAIESHLSFLIGLMTNDDVVEEVADDLCKSTLAYALSTDDEQLYFIKLFRAIATNITNNADKIPPVFQAKAMIGILNTIQITEWIDDNAENLSIDSLDKLPELIFQLAKNIFDDEEKYSDDIVQSLFAAWVAGEPIFKIYNSVKDSLPARNNIINVEKYCKKNLSYSFSFLVGSIIDLGDKIDDAVKMFLQIFQKKVKYGLGSITAISIYEQGISDRIIAQQISELLGNDMIQGKDILIKMKQKQNEILQILTKYPSYFIAEFETLCK